MLALTQAGRGHLAMLGFSLGIAGSFSLGNQAANEIDAVVITAARFVLVIPLMGLLAVIGGRVRLKDFESPWRYFVIGGLMSVYFVLMFEGLKSSTAVSISAVATLVPAMTAVFGWLLLRQATTSRMVGALAIGGAGAVWVIFRGDLNALAAFNIGRGEAVFLVGCAAHALVAPIMRSLNRGEAPPVFVFGMAIASAMMLIIYGWKEIASTDWHALPSIVWITIAYLTVVSTGLTFLALSYASLRLPSAKVMAYTYLTPSWVIAWEAASGRGFPSLEIVSGVLATVVALLILLRQEKAHS